MFSGSLNCITVIALLPNGENVFAGRYSLEVMDEGDKI